MKELINLARGFSQQFECALVYGIANVTQLDNLFKVNAKQFVIVEADPGVFSKLEEWHTTLPESAPTVSCYHAAITQEDAPTTLLYQASQPGFSSTAKPNQIKRFRPGLTFSSVSVPAKKLSYCTDKYVIAANQHNIALINSNGAEHQLLSDSTSQLCSNIVVKTCSKALFGENTQLPAAFTDTGYSQVKIKSAQPPMSLTALCKPLLVLEQASALKKARQEAEQYKQQASDLAAQNETLTEQRDNQREHHLKNKEWAEQLKSQKQDLETQLEQSEKKAKQLSEKLESAKANLQEAQAREKNIRQAVREETERTTSLREKNEKLTSEVAAITTENSALQDELTAVQQKLENINEQFAAKADILQVAQKEIEELQDRLQLSGSECAQAKAALAASQREREEIAERHKNAKTWAENLNETNEALNKKIEHLVKNEQDLTKQNKLLEESLAAEHKRESQIAATLELNTKLMTKIQLDYENLQKQYEQKVHSEAELKQLVMELHQKLQKAATFYHKLEKEYPELLGE